MPLLTLLAKHSLHSFHLCSKGSSHTKTQEYHQTKLKTLPQSTSLYGLKVCFKEREVIYLRSEHHIFFGTALQILACVGNRSWIHQDSQWPFSGVVMTYINSFPCRNTTTQTQWPANSNQHHCTKDPAIKQPSLGWWLFSLSLGWTGLDQEARKDKTLLALLEEVCQHIHQGNNTDKTSESWQGHRYIFLSRTVYSLWRSALPPAQINLAAVTTARAMQGVAPSIPFCSWLAPGSSSLHSPTCSQLLSLHFQFAHHSS